MITLKKTWTVKSSVACEKFTIHIDAQLNYFERRPVACLIIFEPCVYLVMQTLICRRTARKKRKHARRQKAAKMDLETRKHKNKQVQQNNLPTKHGDEIGRSDINEKGILPSIMYLGEGYERPTFVGCLGSTLGNDVGTRDGASNGERCSR